MMKMVVTRKRKRERETQVTRNCFFEMKMHPLKCFGLQNLLSSSALSPCFNSAAHSPSPPRYRTQE